MMNMDFLRILSVLVWTTVLLSRSPNIYRVIRGRARYYDVLWSLIGIFGANVIGFNLRWLLRDYAFDTISVWIGLYLFSNMIGVATLFVIAQYQRADHHGR